MTPRVEISAFTSSRAGLGNGRQLWAEEADAGEGVGERTEVSFTEIITGRVENVGVMCSYWVDLIEDFGA